MGAWIWMKLCMSTGVGTWTNWSTFEPDPNHSPDARTRKSESQRSVEVGQTGTSLRAGYRMYCWEILFTPQWSPRAREFPGYGFSVQRMVVELRGIKVAQFSDFGLFKKMILFTASRGNTFVGGTCDLPSALLVTAVFSKDKSRSTSF